MMMNKGLGLIVGVVTILLFASSADAVVTTDGLVSWWKLDQNANDSWEGPHYNNGTEVGGPTYTSSTAGPGSSYALQFDEDNDYVNCGKDASLNPGTSDFTLEAWIKTGESLVTQAIAGKYYYSGDWNNDTFNMLTVGGKIQIEMNDKRVSSGYQTGYKGSVNIADNSWHHIVGVFDRDGKMNIYVDKVKDGTGYDISHKTASIDPIYNFRIAARDKDTDSASFNGVIDEVRFYSKALSVDDIKDNYDAMMIPEPSALLLLGVGLLGLFAFKRIGGRVHD